MQTVFGDVKTRKGSSRISDSHSVFLKDNPELKPVFEWLKDNKILSVNDVKSPVQGEAFRNIEFQHEVIWNVDEKFWIIHFSCCYPFQGDFEKAIPEYLDLFKKIINRPYKPEYANLLKEASELESQLLKLKEQMKEEV